MENAPRIWNLADAARGLGLILAVLVALITLLLMTGDGKQLLTPSIYFFLLAMRLLIYLVVVHHWVSITPPDD